MHATPKIQNGSRDLTTPLLRVVCHIDYDLILPTCIQNWMTLASAVLEISLGLVAYLFDDSSFNRSRDIIGAPKK